MRRFDLPPVWLLLFVVLALVIGRADPWRLHLPAWLGGLAGGLALGGGALLPVLAVAALRRAGTTLHPGGQARVLVTRGIFARSRNPIYLGMVLILTGIAFWAGNVLALALPTLFALLIERRFILAEERLLRRTFRAGYARYERATRRWF